MAAPASSHHRSTERSTERSRREVLRAVEQRGVGTEAVAEWTGALGTTPKDVVLAHGTMKLFHYRPLTDDVYRVPVLIVASLVNRSYILDLAPGQSLIEFLLRQGFDVYLIDWGVPRREHRDTRLEDYVLDFIPRCVERVQEDSGEPDVSLLGYCVGGLLAVLYAALHPQAPVKNLVCFATPVNSDGLVSLKTWMSESAFDAEAMVRLHGNVPADFIQDTLRMLRPFGKPAGQLALLDKVDDEDFVTSNLRFSKWESDNVPFVGGAFKQMVEDFLRGNKLLKGTWRVGGNRIDPKKIQAPFLHLVAQSDHITPYESSRDLVKMVGSKDKQEIVLKGGHVGLVAGRGAIKQMWPALEQWLARRSV